ncbi:hypothetical protein [Spiroplasma sp. DGKH1]|uniref:hypothetical protein n=1 Tax=Spiroplasma sp. DGKH1 TaxID=3050074 RepID=UPI0034C6773D
MIENNKTDLKSELQFLMDQVVNEIISLVKYESIIIRKIGEIGTENEYVAIIPSVSFTTKKKSLCKKISEINNIKKQLILLAKNGGN